MRCCRAVDKRGAGEACATPMINRHLSSFDMIRIFKCNRGLTFFDFKTHPLQLQEGPRLHLKMRMRIMVLLDAHLTWPTPQPMESLTSMLNTHNENHARLRGLTFASSCVTRHDSLPMCYNAESTINSLSPLIEALKALGSVCTFLHS